MKIRINQYTVVITLETIHWHCTITMDIFRYSTKWEDYHRYVFLSTAAQISGINVGLNEVYKLYTYYLLQNKYIIPYYHINNLNVFYFVFYIIKKICMANQYIIIAIMMHEGGVRMQYVS